MPSQVTTLDDIFDPQNPHYAGTRINGHYAIHLVSTVGPDTPFTLLGSVTYWTNSIAQRHTQYFVLSHQKYVTGTPLMDAKELAFDIGHRLSQDWADHGVQVESITLPRSMGYDRSYHSFPFLAHQMQVHA